MLLGGFVLFGCAYLLYAQVLGWLDGLPQLPEQFLKEGKNDFRPPENPDSPTQVKLALAFGPKAPETDYALYETQLEFRSGDSSIVLAAGPAPFSRENPSK